MCEFCGDKIGNISVILYAKDLEKVRFCSEECEERFDMMNTEVYYGPETDYGIPF